MTRLVFVTGDKGGVGKSFTSRLLLDWYLKSGSKVRAFDTDKTNSTLFRFFKDVESPLFDLDQLDTDDQPSLDQFLNEIVSDEEDSIFMVDCAARTMERLLAWMSDLGFFELAKEHSIKLTLAFVLGPELDCVQILKDMSDSFQENAEYVLVKNLGKGSQFKVYDESKTRTRILNEWGGKEISIPNLVPSTSLEIDRLCLPFHIAKEGKELGIAERSRVSTFQAKAFAEFDQVGDLCR